MSHISDNLCKFLEWDTDFFGYRIARVLPRTINKMQAEAIDIWCIENKIDCLYFMADSQDSETIRLAEDNHYRQVDVRNVYELDLKKTYQSAKIPDGFTLDVAISEDTAHMLPMIDNAFVHTRFYHDPLFSNDQANELYRTWLIRSIEENFADRVLVIRKHNKPQAFITCSLDSDAKTGSIGLIGVADFARGQNLGATLVLSSFQYFEEQQMKLVQVVTQGRNIVANRLYQKCGFRTSEVYLWYHKWYTKSH